LNPIDKNSDFDEYPALISGRFSRNSLSVRTLVLEGSKITQYNRGRQGCRVRPSRAVGIAPVPERKNRKGCGVVSNAIDTAKFFVYLATLESEEPMLLTPMHVQKLLYYAQGWHLAAKGKPLFRETVEAWAHGPVVREVYARFAKYGNQPIPCGGTIPGSLSKDDLVFVRSIWASYREFSAPALWKMTHSERPYLETRKGLDQSAPSDRPISRDIMREFFEAQYGRRALPGLELETLKRSQAEADAGQTVSFDEVFANLGE
jgi:uncharacterized phage-associated protein